MIVTIDGPAASGKSTTARQVARQLNWLYLDTGAMYRALAVHVLDQRIPLDEEEAIARLAEQTRIKLEPSEQGCRVFVDGNEVTSRIRSPEVDRAVGPVCEVDKVREVMVRLQRSMVEKGDVVAEGRDMGTVVFPNADLKFYMIASIEERAKRRKIELEKLGIHMPFKELKKEIENRDRRDSSRENSPLTRAEDAVLIDTTRMDIQEQVNHILDLVRKKQS